MFGGSKLFASSFLFSSSLLALNQKKPKVAECEPSKAVENSAADLDAIFAAAASEGGMPPDAEEIQEMLMKAQGRSIRYIQFNNIIHIL